MHPISRKPLLLLCTAAASVAIAAPLAAAGIRGAHVKGTWVATGPGGKMVLVLRGSGASYRGTYAAGGKTSNVQARVDNADGAIQVLLTFKSPHRSAFCGLRAAKLYCNIGTRTTVFRRG